MKNKIFILLIIACFAVGCENCDSFPDKFNVNGITCINYQIYRYDSTDVMLGSIISVNPIKYDSFALGILSTYNTYYSQYNWFNKYLSVSSAFACSPPILSSNEIVESIYITSNLKWDNEHLAGDTLNDIIELVFYQIDSPIVLKLPIDLDTFISQQPTAKQNYFLRFKSSPLIESNYSFKVHYKQKNGEIYSAESIPITIKP